jgi:hypothetical protein
MSLLNSYGKPTPKFWRKLGDSVLAAGTVITGYAIAEHTDWLAYTSLGLSVLGKFLTNLFSEE